MKKLWFNTLTATFLLCVIAPIGFRVDGILITLQTFIIFLIASVLGKKVGLYSTLLYILIGALGAPVFGGYSAGWEKLIGNTAGFIWAFPLVAYGLGWLCEKYELHFLNYLKFFFLAHIALIIIGFTVLKVMESGVILFETFQLLIPGLLIKTIAGGLLGSWLVRRFGEVLNSKFKES